MPVGFCLFTFVFKHRASNFNCAADSLSRRASLLVTLQTEITAFDFLKDQYANDDDFGDLWSRSLQHDPTRDFHIQQGFLFKGKQLCIPKISLWAQLIHELYSNGLAALTGHDKTIAVVEDRFF